MMLNHAPMTDVRHASAAFMSDRHELLAFIQGLCGDPGMAEDILQEVWIALSEAVQKRHDIRSVPAWCRTVARHTFLRQRRAAKRERPDDEAVAHALEQAFTLSPRDDHDWSKHLQALRRCLAALGSGGQRLLIRRYLDGAETPTLAVEEVISEEAVLMRLSRLRSRLRRCVDRQVVGKENA